jgi:nucleoside-diphosphate-sugar epimerase
MNWANTRVLVTGGASFIGSALVDALLARGANVRVVDNLSSGKLENIQHHLQKVELVECDLLQSESVSAAVGGWMSFFIWRPITAVAVTSICTRGPARQI